MVGQLCVWLDKREAVWVSYTHRNYIFTQASVRYGGSASCFPGNNYGCPLRRTWGLTTSGSMFTEFQGTILGKLEHPSHLIPPLHTHIPTRGSPRGGKEALLGTQLCYQPSLPNGLSHLTKNSSYKTPDWRLSCLKANGPQTQQSPN